MALMAGVGQDDNRAGKQALDLRPGNAVFPAMRQIAVIPLEPRNQPIHNKYYMFVRTKAMMPGYVPPSRETVAMLTL